MTFKSLAKAVSFISVAAILTACSPITPTVTSVGKRVTTLQKSSSIAGCTGNPTSLATEPQDWWNQMPPANHKYPFAGWQVHQTGAGGCNVTRIDAYRAVVTFNLAGVSNLKGLVQKAELVLKTRAMPSGAGTTLNAGPFGQPGSINLFCPSLIGGGGSLVPFGPADAVPTTNPLGNFEMLDPNPFPTGRPPVYTLPTGNLVSGPLPGATLPTTASPNGLGGSAFVTDVTARVNAALNANAATLSWMLTSNLEGPLPAPLTAPNDCDCRTSYDFDLNITHY